MMIHIKFPFGPVFGTAGITVLVTFDLSEVWSSAEKCSSVFTAYSVSFESIEYEESDISDASDIHRKTLKITGRTTKNLLMEKPSNKKHNADLIILQA